MNKRFLVAGLGTAILNFPHIGIAEQSDSHHVVDEVVVTATPLNRTVEQLAQPTTVVDSDELARRQEASVAEAIANQLGVSATYFGPVASRPVIRGQFGERVRVLSNSLDALDASALSEDHAVSVDGIIAERVEIIRGPATLLYGSGAAGGLINIVDSRLHEQPLGVPWSGALSLGTGTATNRKQGAVKFDFGTDRVIAHIDAFRRDTGDVEIPGFAESALLRALEEAEHDDDGDHDEHEEEEAFGRIENTSSESDGGALGLSFLGNRGMLGVSVSQYNSDYGIPGHHHEHEENDADHGDEEGEEIVRIALEQTRYDIRGELALDNAIESLKVRIARNDYGHTELEGDEIGTVFDSQGTDIRMELRHAPINALQGAIGLQYKQIDFAATGDEAFVPSTKTDQVSLFAFEELPLGNEWVLQASTRAEHQGIRTTSSDDYSNMAYGASLGAIWSPRESLTLAGNVSLTERHPNATELYADGPHLAVQRYERGAETLGLGTLDNERSANIDLTLRIALPRWEANLTGFINDIDDYILLAPTGEEEDELPVFEYGQTDAELIGFEAEVMFDLLQRDDRHLHARLFSDFVQGEQKSGAYLPRIPPLRVGLGFHYTDERFDASVEASRYSKQEKTASNELPTADYTMIDVGFSYRLADPDLMFYVRGRNLGDEDARRHSSPLKDIAPLPGRSLHAGIRWDF